MSKPTIYISFASLIAMSLVSPALAQADTPEELEKIYACRDIPDDTERLACFDASVGTLKQAEVDGEIVALSKETIQTTRREGFGLDLSGLTRLGSIFGPSKNNESDTPKKNALTVENGETNPAVQIQTDEDGEVERVTYPVARTRQLSNGRYRILLENGQIWETRENRRLRFSKSQNGEPDTVTIRRAFAGSFLLRLNDKGEAVRVKRLK